MEDNNFFYNDNVGTIIKKLAIVMFGLESIASVITFIFIYTKYHLFIKTHTFATDP